VNEASVEKASRERMIEVVLEVDGRPLTEFGCDGVILATPTGSTAYAFSAGGPVVWPEVEALLIVPLSAHALFCPAAGGGAELGARRSELMPAPGRGCSGATGGGAVPLPPGARVEVRRSSCPDPAGPAVRRRRSPTVWWQVRAAGARLAGRRPGESSGPGTLVDYAAPLCCYEMRLRGSGVIRDARPGARARADRGLPARPARQDDGGDRASGC
jgi:NAD+ kinase